MEPTVALYVRIPVELRQRLEAAAQAEHATLAEVTIRVLSAGLGMKPEPQPVRRKSKR